MSENIFDFEKSFARLEEILEKMNSGNLSLNESLKLYEEADSLISACSSCLNQAEQKIEVLIKNRNGELATTGAQKPAVQDFYSEQTSSGMNFRS